MAVRSGLLVFFVWAAAVSCQFEKAASTSNGVNTCSCEPTCSASGTATYKVTFNFEWPSDNYPRPQNFPHWSPPVLATHSSCAVVWRNGLTATSGTEQLAEFGRTSTINTEIRGLGDSVRETRTLSSVSTAAGTATTDLKADQFRHSLTALSMIAPSSDWFVGVDSVPLCVNNSWIQSATHNLYPWDAGSDDRNTYNFGGVSTNTNPRENITRIRTSNYPQAFVPSGVDTVPMGTLDISRISMDTAVAATPQAQCSKCSGTCTRSYDIIPGTQASSPTASTAATTTPTKAQTTTPMPTTVQTTTPMPTTVQITTPMPTTVQTTTPMPTTVQTTTPMPTTVQTTPPMPTTVQTTTPMPTTVQTTTPMPTTVQTTTPIATTAQTTPPIATAAKTATPMAPTTPSTIPATLPTTAQTTTTIKKVTSTLSPPSTVQGTVSTTSIMTGMATSLTSASAAPSLSVSPTFGSTTSDLPVATSRSATTSANTVPVRNMTMLGSGNGSGSDRLTISTTAFTTVLSLLSLGLANLLV